jgi:predicted DNA-binding transcriptional regulator AlpA
METAHSLPWVEVLVRQPAKPLLKRNEVCQYLEIGPEALDNLISSGQFPKPIQLAPKTHRWRSEWVRWYLDYRELSPRLVAEKIEDDPVSQVLGGIGSGSPVSGGKRRSSDLGP